jgi:23S rRNA (uracil1939-C5)-methyltransferase
MRGRFDAVVLDPPRQGCPGSVLEAVGARLRPRRIVLVSCAPEALAREGAQLERLGYAARPVQPVDMFPHTPHIEAVAALDVT